MLRQWLFVFSFVVAAAPAWASGIAVVDFQRAVMETTDGKAAQDKLDTMYASRKSEIDKLRSDLEGDFADYQARQMILSDEARAETEKGLVEKQQKFEAKYGQYQEEMQKTYYALLQDLDEKMRILCEKIAKEKTYDVVLDRAAVVYAGGTTIDMTDELIRRYNAMSALPTPAPKPTPAPGK